MGTRLLTYWPAFYSVLLYTVHRAGVVVHMQSGCAVQSLGAEKGKSRRREAEKTLKLLLRGFAGEENLQHRHMQKHNMTQRLNNLQGGEWGRASCRKVNSQPPAGAMRGHHPDSTQCTAGWSYEGHRESLWPTVAGHAPDCAPDSGKHFQVFTREWRWRKFRVSDLLILLEKFFQQWTWPKLVQVEPLCHPGLHNDLNSYTEPTASPR